MKDEKDKKEKIKKEAVDPKPEEKNEESMTGELKVEAPACRMVLVQNKEGGVDCRYSPDCSKGIIRGIAGVIAVDGISFKPDVAEEEKPEETFFLKSDREKSKKKIMDMTKEEIAKDFEEKMEICEKGKEPETIEGLEKRLEILKKERADQEEA